MELLIISALVILLGILIKRKLDEKYRNYSSLSGNRLRRVKNDRGVNGEFQVFHVLEQLKMRQSHLLLNLYLPKGNGKMTEMDVVMVCTAGIFVFESKNYSGWLFGDQRKRYWTQTFSSGRKNKFFNPLWQNEGHIQAIKHVLKRHEDHLFRSYLVFSGDCILKKIRYDKDQHTIIKIQHLDRQIRKDLKELPDVFTPQEATCIFKKLEPYRLADTKIPEPEAPPKPKSGYAAPQKSIP